MQAVPAERTIREITNDELKRSARVIRESHRTVARELGINKENAPRNASFITVRQLRELKERGVELFGLFCGKTQTGFVAVEKAEEDIYYLEKLAVLPGHRHKGYGEALVKFVIDYSKNKGCKTLSLGYIYENTVLRDWYKSLGFKDTGTEIFPHLPFTVGFMEITTD